MVDQDLQVALGHHQAGRLAQAEELYRQILVQHPHHADALQLLGTIAGQRGQMDMAIDLMRRSIAVRPDYVPVIRNLGALLAQAGRLEESVETYRRILAIAPSDPEALNDLGSVLLRMDQVDEAIDSFSRATKLEPGFADAFRNLSYALRKKGRNNEALAASSRAVQLQPNRADGLFEQGQCLAAAARGEEALAAFRGALKYQPGFADAENNIGKILAEMGKLDEGLAALRRAIALKPDSAEAHNNLGSVLKDLGRSDEAVASYRQAIRLNPHFAEAHSNLILGLLYHPAADAKTIQCELGRWNQQHAEPLGKFIQPPKNDRDPHRRLRVGYVSPDFREHVVGRNLLPLLREHDHGRVEIFCYSNLSRGDTVTEQFREHADAWHEVAKISDAEAAELIRRDRIDILVDLAVHTANHRLAVFARKPAPVQATFAGYPGSTGLSAMDYRLTDPYLDPPGMNDSFYTEKSVRLPESFWCYDPLSSEHVVNALPAESAGFVTFGCLNNFCKVNEEVLKLWARVLKAMDRSRMMILWPEGSRREPLMESFRREGIEPERIELVGRRPRRQYLEHYHRIDLGLDTFPYNGHTTSLDSYWMGVPVVTLVGRTVVGRAGLSQLSNLGLTELIAKTPGEYVEIAAQLAGDLPRLAQLRRTLRERMQKSPLMDAPRFARNIEAVYRWMWREWCAKAK